MTTDNDTWVNTPLDQAHLSELAAIMQYHGFKHRTEMIRYLIRQESRSLGIVTADALHNAHTIKTSEVS